MRLVVALLFVACAPKRVPEEEASSLPVAPPPAATPIATRLQAPDAGPFDFSQKPEEQKPFVSGDMDHAGKVPGTLVNAYGH